MDAGWRKPLYYSDQILHVINISISISGLVATILKVAISLKNYKLSHL